jgi:regulator of protease activity HflC (stomatin/prohibitin superfamily)
MMNKQSKLYMKLGVFGGLAVTLLIVLVLTVGINDAGYRTVIQLPTGHTWVKFEPGVYFSFFGKTKEYPDVVTFDHDKEEDEEEATLTKRGITVRYQDGGLGTIYGKARFALPTDEQSMLKLHKAFRSPAGVGNKLIKPVAEEATNMTAGLMTSEDAYANKRGIFIQWTQDQIANGKYATYLESKQVKNEQGETEWKKVPVIRYDEKTGQPIHHNSDFKEYGITLMGYQITDWDFEKKTLQQISAKREATMAIITAKANAERAKQDAITAEEQGKANVMAAKYEKEVEKQKALVEAQKQQEVAVIKAQQRVKVAEQVKLEAEQKKLAAAEYKQEQILRGEGDAEYKRLVMEADGALAQKLEAYKYATDRWAAAVEKQKWVPEIQMGSSSGGGNLNAANQMVELLMVKTAKDLKLDLQPKQ